MVTIVVVEDEPAALERYCAYLEERGDISVVGRCRSAANAEPIVLASRPDAIFTDIRMPGEDGIAFLERMRAAGWSGIAVVISGYDDFGFAQRSIRAGVFDYLLKPVFQNTMDELLSRVASKLREAPAEELSGQASCLPGYIVRAKDFVDRHVGEPCTLEAVAHFAHVSPTHLSASFKRFLGRGFLEYARDLRIEAAKKMLLETTLSLKEIAERLSYPDLPTFSKAFKKTAGVPPGGFRQSHEEGV